MTDTNGDSVDDEGGSSSGGSSTGKTPDYTKQLKKLNDINDNLKVLLTISDNLKLSIQRNVYEEKDLFINLLAGQLFANNNFDYGNKNSQVEAKNALNRAKILANLLTFKK